MSASMYHAIEDLERQLDACVDRVHSLEVHVRTEIDQQREEMQKLRGQLRRALAAVSETLIMPADDGAQPETATASEAGPEAFADLLPGSGDFDTPSALVFDDDPDFLDPFASVLPEVAYEAEDVQDDAMEAPVDALETPIAEELSVSEFSVEEPPVAQIGFVEEAEYELEAELEASTASEEAGANDDEAEAIVEAEAPANSPAWSGPVDPSVMSNFIIPADAFVSEQDDMSSEPAVPEPKVERPHAERTSEQAPEQPKPLSEFDRLLDWSDFEVEGADEQHDESPLPTSSGDGITATHAPPRPTVRQDRNDRPVTVSRRVPELISAESLEQKIGDDLTVISGIDAEMQEALRQIGIISLDEIASWHPADAQRIAAQLGTASDREIFDVWVPEAQSALFDLFQQRLRSNRFHNLDEM
ncbi:MAG: hypothetical protein ABJF88_07585 [Rhodothermales bacterium]